MRKKSGLKRIGRKRIEQKQKRKRLTDGDVPGRVCGKIALCRSDERLAPGETPGEGFCPEVHRGQGFQRPDPVRGAPGGRRSPLPGQHHRLRRGTPERNAAPLRQPSDRRREVPDDRRRRGCQFRRVLGAGDEVRRFRRRHRQGEVPQAGLSLDKRRKGGIAARRNISGGSGFTRPAKR